MTSTAHDAKTTNARHPFGRSASEEAQDRIIIDALSDRVSDLELSITELGHRESSRQVLKDVASRCLAAIRMMTGRPTHWLPLALAGRRRP